MTDDLAADVVVVGGGNAAMCAALAAHERGAEVLVLERAPEQERGGDTAFTAGAMRVVYDSVDHLRELVRDLSDAELATTDFGVYPASAFYDDMAAGHPVPGRPGPRPGAGGTEPRHPPVDG